MSASRVETTDRAQSQQAQTPNERVIAFCLGHALWGPLKTPMSVGDFDEFKELYEGFDANMEAPTQMWQAFLNGTKRAVFSRVVHLDGNGDPVSAAKSTITAPTGIVAPTKGAVLGTIVGPYTFVDGDTIICKVDGGADDTATFNATAAFRTTGATETYALTNGMDLVVEVDGGSPQTILFLTAEFVSIGAATAEEVGAVIAAKLLGVTVTVPGGTNVTITSDSKGTGSGINVVSGTANAALTFTTGLLSGTGDVVDINSVTVAEIKTLVEADVTGVTVTDVGGAVQIETDTAGAAGSIQVTAPSTADDEVGLDNAVHAGLDGTAATTLTATALYYGGTIGNALALYVEAADDAVAAHFNLSVYLSGLRKEIWRNVTMDSADTLNYVLNRVNTSNKKSRYIVLVDNAAPGTTLQRRPANVSALSMAGGDDGLSAIADADFTGSELLATGVYAFDSSDYDRGVLSCPDRVTATAHDAMDAYSTARGRKFIFLSDAPKALDDDGAIAYEQTRTVIGQSTGVYWPNLLIPNPDKVVFGQTDTITVHVSGSLSGLLSKNQRLYANDEFKQPGNKIYGRLVNVVGVEDESTKRMPVRSKITPFRINPVVLGKLQGGRKAVWLDDVMALEEGGNWESVGEMHGVSVIRADIAAYLETQRTTANTEDARLEDEQKLEAYLAQWAGKGAFFTRNLGDAFYVNTDPLGKTINNPVEQNAERYTVIVGLATAKSRRFIFLVFTRDTRSIESFVLSQAA